MKRTFLEAAILAAVICVTGCTTTGSYRLSGDTIDHSAEARIADTGALRFEQDNWRIISAIAPKPVYPSSPSEILVQGELVYKASPAREKSAASYYKDYTWRGFVRFGDKEFPAEFKMVMTALLDGSQKAIDFKPAVMPAGTVTFLKVSGQKVPSFPYKVADCSTNGTRYGMYAVLEPEWTSDEAEADSPTPALNRADSTITDVRQVFQIIRSDGVPVAGISYNSWFIYDTLPADQIETVKQLIGVLRAYVWSMSELINTSGWLI